MPMQGLATIVLGLPHLNYAGMNKHKNFRQFLY